MGNSKKIIVAILIVLILVLISGGVFAYVYLATDLLKSDQEMFFKYFAQITSEDGFIDGRIKKYNEKKQQNPYENSGEITFDVDYSGALADEKIIEKVNDLSIRYSGQTDIVGQKVEKDIEIDYGNDVILPIQYRQDGNEYGLQFDDISKKFIAIRNENLDELIEKFTGESLEDSMSIDMSEVTEMNENIQFTEDEINQLKQIYGTVLQEQLVAENFSKTKTEQGENYSLELNGEQIKNIIIKMLEATKQNTLIIDKMNEIMLAMSPDAEKIESSEIDTIITAFNEEDFTEMPNLKLTLGQTNKILNQIIMEYGPNKITIIKNTTEDSLSYEISCEIKYAEEENLDTESSAITPSDLSPGATSNIKDTLESAQANLYFNMQYSGLQELNNIKENYELGYSISAEDIVMKSDYKISSNTQFIDSVSIEELSTNNAVFLNDHDAEVITNFMSQVGTRLLEVNKKQMEQLGLEEYENPLIYSNPSTLMIYMGIMVFDMASETVEDASSMSEYLIQQHNGKFESYLGEGVTGSAVNAMLKTVFNHNLAQDDEKTKVSVTGKVNLTVDANQPVDKVSTSNIYKVEAIYNEEGYITEIKVTIQN